MKGFLWGGDTSKLTDPGKGLNYAALLRMTPITEGAIRGLGGLLLSLAGYSILLPGIAWLLLGLFWLIRGLPGSFADYRASALQFEMIDGLVATHLAIATLIVLCMWIMRYVHGRHPRWLCSVQPGFRWRYTAACALASVVLLNAVYWVSHLDDLPTWSPDDHVWWWLLAIGLTAPLQAAGEEFLFRGYLLQVCGTVSKSPWLAVAISAVIFAALHGSQNLPLLADRLAFGLLAGALVVLTGGLEASIAAHAVNNVFAFGYAAAAGNLAEIRSIQVSTWQTTGWNVLAYALVALVAWLIGRKMRVATKTPGQAGAP
ncbi:type II CAAX endopeptidase family protein [Propionimicrobium sp. PCR01-08-3]|uniref:CPBP family intramembrane glutamic endopeptidase n=1 Tax=Propionimicrobium sp. PCR01-08-3 TaxID=3052086 RepID=UPI00255CA634|nr:type II CAAX endopeptidase family protein [Propionimicrobium sp. PCR01-08-3]WIY83630.1 type II CAAX endopeptidase family protein [Propionimicrobium sp. PCR01-08-3]